MGSATLAYPLAGPHLHRSVLARVELGFLQIIRVIWTWRMTSGLRKIWNEICIPSGRTSRGHKSR